MPPRNTTTCAVKPVSPSGASPQVHAALDLAWSSHFAGRRPRPLLPAELLPAESPSGAGPSGGADGEDDASGSDAGPRDGGIYSPPVPFPRLSTAAAASAVRACFKADYLEGAFRVVRASQRALRSAEPYDALVAGCARRDNRALAERSLREVRAPPPLGERWLVHPAQCAPAAVRLRRGEKSRSWLPHSPSATPLSCRLSTTTGPQDPRRRGTS